MRDIPPDLLAAINGGAASLCTCWLLTRADGTKLGFTDHDRDLVLAGTPCAAATGWTAGAAETELGVKAGTATTTGALDPNVLESVAITEADIAAGRYDGAVVEAWRADWTAPETAVLLWRGTIARLVRTGAAFTAEIEGPLWRLQRAAGRLYGKGCDARLGDARCRADVSGAAFNGVGAVVSADGDRRLVVSGLAAFAAGWFGGGLLTWTTGANAGAVQTVAGHLVGETGVVLVLEEAALQGVAAGDAFTVVAGCDKAFSTCGSKFSNLANFQGFPDIPGDDYLAVNAATAPRTDGGSRRTGS
jgi:uncharacterized phage protein (TIGR02218 family)